MDAESLMTTLLRLQLAASAAIVVVLLLRPLVLRAFGSGAAYRLWLVVPLAATSVLLPAREQEVTIPAADVPVLQQFGYDLDVGVMREHAATAPADDAGMPDDHSASGWLVALWLLGAVAFLIRSIVNTRRLSSGPSVGPALVGVLRPRIVLPLDFETRFNTEERALILAHEEMHRASRHTLVNALVEVARCASWFNPLLHWAALRFRADQELACDTAVIAAHPEARRTYAEALLKAQVAGVYLPMGCAWTSGSAGRMAERIQRLSDQPPGRCRRLAGAAAVIGIGIAASYATWAQQPPRIITVQQPNPEAATGVPEVGRPSASQVPVPTPTAPVPKSALSTAAEREPVTPAINGEPAAYDSIFAIRAAFAMDAVTDDRPTRQVNGVTVSNQPWEVGPDGKQGTYGTTVCRVTRDGGELALSGADSLARLAANCQPIIFHANHQRNMALVTGGQYQTEDAILQFAATHQELLREPEYRKLVLTQVRPLFYRRYPRLDQELRLSEQELHRLFDLLAENDIARRADLIARLQRPTLERPTPGSQVDRQQEAYRAILAATLASRQEFDRKQEESIQALLGDKYAQWLAVNSRAQQMERERQALHRQQMERETLRLQQVERERLQRIERDRREELERAQLQQMEFERLTQPPQE